MSLKINRICLNCSFLVALLLFFQFSHAQDFAQVDALLQKNQKTLLGNNATVLIYKDGKVIHQKDLGEFNAKTQTPIGNSSQWLTAALVMQFVDEGKLELDDPVVKYLPIFAKYMKNYVTIRQCITNTTGIESEKNPIAKRKKYTSLEEEVNAYAAKEISNNAGTEFHYGAIGFCIAGRVLEVISKKSFDRLIQEKLLRPLKMRGTTFTDDGGNAPDPAAGAKSSGNDYITFLGMLLNGGVSFDGKRILSEKAIAEMQQAQATTLPVKFTPKALEGNHFGLGVWILDEDNSGKSTVVGSPNLQGTWPYVDKCHNYAALILTQHPLAMELKKDFAIQFKQAVDDVVGGGCK